MPLRDPPDLASLAVEACLRGWMGPADVWAASARFVDLGANASPEKVLGASLTREQIATLLSSASGEQTAVLESPSDTISTESVASARLPPSDGDSGTPPARYQPGTKLGAGGSGLVTSALDQATGRTVALKSLRRGLDAGATELQRFMREARITARLEHPAVIPVYDVGHFADGRPFFAMRIVTRRTLRELLDVPPPRADWPLSRLCAVFVQVCRAMAYAHARGVVHRDIKPANILLGDYGEVYVADWGVAKVLGESDIQSPDYLPIDPSSPGATAQGSLLGTIGYMPPEQIRGEHATLDARADLFSLGVVLYEIITGRHPFRSRSDIATVLATVEREPIPPRQIVSAAPVVLEDLCLRLLSKDREARPGSADEVAAEVEAFLEGAKERARREQEALRLAERGREHVAVYNSLVAETERLQSAARSAMRRVKPWEDVTLKREAWAHEDDARLAEIEQAKELAASIESYLQALGYDPDSATVRAGVADLYFSRLLRAERQRDIAAQRYNESLVLQYDNGRYAARLSAKARLSVTTDPPGATVVLYRLVEHDRVLTRVEPRALGVTPVAEIELDPGSHVLVLDRVGFRAVQQPVSCTRGEHRREHVTLYRDADIGTGFIHVPAGECVLGGDPEAPESLPWQQVHIDDFAIARLPVTFGDYLRFIEDLWQRDPSEAEARVPQSDRGEGRYAEREAGGRWVARYDLLIEGDAQSVVPRERAGELPIQSVSWFDAQAYVSWLSRRDGLHYRLPTEAEWEKAARGIDGRWFPWGDRFDATFAKMRDSRPWLTQSEIVGRFDVDRSVYGVADLAGGMRCWVADIHGALDATAALESARSSTSDRASLGNRISRGGSWVNSAPFCRSAARVYDFAVSRFNSIGIRVAHSPGRDR